MTLLGVSCVFALGVMMTAPLALSESDGVPRVMCAYIGTEFNVSYNFSVNDVPARCEEVWYTYYALDANMTVPNANAIAALVAANKRVYLTVLFSLDDQPWVDIINSNGTNAYSTRIDAMVQYMKDNRISGIILDSLGFWDGYITNFPKKLNQFINRIKADIPPPRADVPAMKVGLMLPAWKYNLYGRRDLFDFAVTNSTVDFYVISLTSMAGKCIAPTRQRYPYSSSTVLSVDDVVNAVAQTGIDRNKLVVNLVVMVFTGGAKSLVISYTQYCRRNVTDDPLIYCADTIQILYDLVTYLKPHFKGIMLSFLDMDDYDGSCGCGQFPVTNAYIDSWESQPVKLCDKISGK